jgi:SAM-dependent methyltransferase
MLPKRPPVDDDVVPRPGFAWEETACLLCGRDEPATVLEAADPAPGPGGGLRFAVVRCRHCGLAYTNPRPTAATIGRFYPDDYRPHAPRGPRAISLPSLFWSRLLGRPCPERRGRLARTGGNRLLDFGCGGGSYLRRMAELGWRVAGVDASPRAVREVRGALGFEVHLGSLPHPDLPPGSFDVVTMWQSLEHVHRPLEVLRAAYELLAPGGRLVVATPSIDGLAADWFGEHWFGLDLPRHLTHFTRNSLARMLRAAGFRVESVRGLVHYHWLRTTAARAGGFWGRVLERGLVARTVAWSCYAAGRADCVVATAGRPD